MKRHAMILHPKQSWSMSCYADFKTPNGCWVMLNYDPTQHSKIKLLAIRRILKSINASNVATHNACVIFKNLLKGDEHHTNRCDD